MRHAMIVLEDLIPQGEGLRVDRAIYAIVAKSPYKRLTKLSRKEDQWMNLLMRENVRVEHLVIAVLSRFFGLSRYRRRAGGAAACHYKSQLPTK